MCLTYTADSSHAENSKHLVLGIMSEASLAEKLSYSMVIFSCDWVGMDRLTFAERRDGNVCLSQCADH